MDSTSSGSSHYEMLTLRLEAKKRGSGVPPLGQRATIVRFVLT